MVIKAASSTDFCDFFSWWEERLEDWKWIKKAQEGTGERKTQAMGRKNHPYNSRAPPHWLRLIIF